MISRQNFELKSMHMTDIFQRVLERERMTKNEGNN